MNSANEQGPTFTLATGATIKGSMLTGATGAASPTGAAGVGAVFSVTTGNVLIAGAALLLTTAGS